MWCILMAVNSIIFILNWHIHWTMVSDQTSSDVVIVSYSGQFTILYIVLSPKILINVDWLVYWHLLIYLYIYWIYIQGVSEPLIDYRLILSVQFFIVEKNTHENGQNKLKWSIIDQWFRNAMYFIYFFIYKYRLETAYFTSKQKRETPCINVKI